jgi:hypothetical protein
MYSTGILGPGRRLNQFVRLTNDFALCAISHSPQTEAFRPSQAFSVICQYQQFGLFEPIANKHN